MTSLSASASPDSASPATLILHLVVRPSHSTIVLRPRKMGGEGRAATLRMTCPHYPPGTAGAGGRTSDCYDYELSAAVRPAGTFAARHARWAGSHCGRPAARGRA